MNPQPNHKTLFGNCRARGKFALGVCSLDPVSGIACQYQATECVSACHRGERMFSSQETCDRRKAEIDNHGVKRRRRLEPRGIIRADD